MDGQYRASSPMDLALYTNPVSEAPMSWRSVDDSGFSGAGPSSDKLSPAVASDGNAQGYDSLSLCRNYTCCNLTLHDLHALVQHFEEVHSGVVRPTSRSQTTASFMNDESPRPTLDQSSLATNASLDPRLLTVSGTTIDGDSSLSRQRPIVLPEASAANDTPLVTPPYSSLAICYVPAIRKETEGSSTTGSSAAIPYPPITPSTDQSRVFADTDHAASATLKASPTVPAALLDAEVRAPAKSELGGSAVLACASPSRSKPFRCTEPRCGKAYKQAKGLRHHLKLGRCPYAPPQDREIAPEKRLLDGQASEPMGCDTERETESCRRYACAVGNCPRSYKTLAGLKYHYSRADLHGLDGLLLIACGLHQSLPLLSGRTQRTMSMQAVLAVDLLMSQSGTHVG